MSGSGDVRLLLEVTIAIFVRTEFHTQIAYHNKYNVNRQATTARAIEEVW